MKKITFLILLFSTTILTAQNLTNISNNLAQVQNSITCWIDIDNDGVQELYMSGNISGSTVGGGLYAYANDTFTLLQGTGLPVLDNGAASAGDFDNDGNLDLLLTGYDETTSTAITDVYLNNADGTFTALNLNLPQCYLSYAQLVDINNDGLLDIALTGMETVGYSNITKIFKNTASGTLIELTGTPIVGMMMGKIKFADYDGDGYQDFALNGWNSNNTPYTQIWHNNGNETFTETTDAITDLWLGDLEWGDYDGDGDVDLIITGTASADSETHLYQNNSGTFTEVANTTLPDLHLGTLEWADFNNDGHLDLYMAGNHHTTTPAVDNYRGGIFLGDGTGVFTENTGVYIIPITYGDAMASDFDGDGYVDIVESGVNDIGNPYTMCYKNGSSATVNTDIIDLFDIYPNPASDVFNISSKYSNYTIEVYDLIGNLFYKQASIGTTHTQINTNHWTKGMYLLKVQFEEKSYTKRLIVK